MNELHTIRYEKPRQRLRESCSRARRVRRAKELLFTGGMIGAEEARQLGMVRVGASHGARRAHIGASAANRGTTNDGTTPCQTVGEPGAGCAGILDRGASREVVTAAWPRAQRRGRWDVRRSGRRRGDPARSEKSLAGKRMSLRDHERSHPPSLTCITGLNSLNSFALFSGSQDGTATA